MVHAKKISLTYSSFLQTPEDIIRYSYDIFNSKLHPFIINLQQVFLLLKQHQINYDIIPGDNKQNRIDMHLVPLSNKVSKKTNDKTSDKTSDDCKIVQIKDFMPNKNTK